MVFLFKMPSPFVFVEMAPHVGDPLVTEQAIRLMQEYIWFNRTVGQRIIDYERSKHIVVATESDGNVVAAGAMQSLTPSLYYVTELATHPNYRYRGYKLGGTLLRMLENTAVLLGGREIALAAKPESKIFFEKQGYQRDTKSPDGTGAMVKYL